MGRGLGLRDGEDGLERRRPAAQEVRTAFELDSNGPLPAVGGGCRCVTPNPNPTPSGWRGEEVVPTWDLSLRCTVHTLSMHTHYYPPVHAHCLCNITPAHTRVLPPPVHACEGQLCGRIPRACRVRVGLAQPWHGHMDALL
jgi:hypothetical protein